MSDKQDALPEFENYRDWTSYLWQLLHDSHAPSHASQQSEFAARENWRKVVAALGPDISAEQVIGGWRFLQANYSPEFLEHAMPIWAKNELLTAREGKE